MTEKTFASQADLEEKKTSFIKLSDTAYAYTAEGDPHSGVIIGDDGVMVIDTTATPLMARALIKHIRSCEDLAQACGWRKRFLRTDMRPVNVAHQESQFDFYLHEAILDASANQ